MTQQYLTGELSLLLGQLEVAIGSGAAAVGVAHLRQEAEKGSGSTLVSVAVRALVAGDRLCWESIARGDCGAFASQAAICSQFWEFCVCAGLLFDRESR